MWCPLQSWVATRMYMNRPAQVGLHVAAACFWLTCCRSASCFWASSSSLVALARSHQSLLLSFCVERAKEYICASGSLIISGQQQVGEVHWEQHAAVRAEAVLSARAGGCFMQKYMLRTPIPSPSNIPSSLVHASLLPAALHGELSPLLPGSYVHP